MKIVVLSKTLNEEKKGGPYKWARILVEGISERYKNKNIDITTLRSNWKHVFNGKIFSGFSEINKSDLIQVYVSNLGIVVLTLYAKIKGKKIVYTCRGNFFEEWKSKTPWLFLKYYVLAKMANYLVFPSEYMRKTITSRIKKPSKVIYGPYDPGKTNFSGKIKKDGNYVFLEVTSFDYYGKAGGVLILAKAFKKFKKKYPKSRLIVVGGGTFLEKIKNKIKEYFSEGDNGIEFLGILEKDKLNEIRNESDCFVHITNLDNLPLALVEACSFRKPIIASNKFGIPEISKKIKLVENNEGNIFNMMESVYKSGIKKVNYPDVKKFEKDLMVDRFVNFYK